MASLTVTSASAALDDPFQATAPLDEAPAEPPPPARQPGDLVARRYRVDRLLERGGMADVYAATDIDLQRPVALKIAAGNPLQADVASERLLREARILASLQHPNIALVHDHGRASHGTAFLVLELIDGRTLRHVLAQSGKLPWRTAVVIATQIAAGLRAAHTRGVVHCDLSPSNVLLARTQQGGVCCKIIDFGIACQNSEARIAPLHGTRRYVAPEVFMAGSTADARLDLYALGVILAEMLADGPDTPVALATYARALQAADPQARPPTAAAVIEDLQRIVNDGDGSTAGSTQQPRLQPSRRPASSRVVRWIAGIAALLAAGALTSARIEQVPPRADTSVARAPPPPLRLQLQAFPRQNQLKMPEVPLPDMTDHKPAVRATPTRPRPAVGPSTQEELKAALLERRQQMARAGLASVDVVAVDDIRFDPSRRSARVVYRRQDSTAYVVEYWALRDGRWQPLDD